MRAAPGAFAVCAAAVLAGCLGSGDTTRTKELPGFDTNTGAIAGLVVDDGLQPVSNATVALDGERNLVTGEGGGFLFEFVLPGTHELAATSDGYLDATMSIEVWAGRSNEATLTLLPREAVEAYFETRIQAGTIFCVLGFRATSANTTSFTACSVGNLVANTSFLETPFLDWKVGSLYGDLVGFWGETFWKTSQALGAGMKVRWFVENRPLGTGQSVAPDYQQGDLGSLEGVSPLAFRMPIEVARNVTNTRAQSGLGAVICPDDRPQIDCWLLSGHFNSAQTLPTGNNNVGFTFQQRYDDYLTLFHGGEMPLFFTALPDQ